MADRGMKSFVTTTSTGCIYSCYKNDEIFELTLKKTPSNERKSWNGVLTSQCESEFNVTLFRIKLHDLIFWKCFQ